MPSIFSNTITPVTTPVTVVQNPLYSNLYHNQVEHTLTDGLNSVLDDSFLKLIVSCDVTLSSSSCNPAHVHIQCFNTSKLNGPLRRGMKIFCPQIPSTWCPELGRAILANTGNLHHMKLSYNAPSTGSITLYAGTVLYISLFTSVIDPIKAQLTTLAVDGDNSAMSVFGVDNYFVADETRTFGPGCTHTIDIVSFEPTSNEQYFFLGTGAPMYSKDFGQGLELNEDVTFDPEQVDPRTSLSFHNTSTKSISIRCGTRLYFGENGSTINALKSLVDNLVTSTISGSNIQSVVQYVNAVTAGSSLPVSVWNPETNLLVSASPAPQLLNIASVKYFNATDSFVVRMYVDPSTFALSTAADDGILGPGPQTAMYVQYKNTQNEDVRRKLLYNITSREFIIDAPYAPQENSLVAVAYDTYGSAGNFLVNVPWSTLSIPTLSTDTLTVTYNSDTNIFKVVVTVDGSGVPSSGGSAGQIKNEYVLSVQYTRDGETVPRSYNCVWNTDGYYSQAINSAYAPTAVTVQVAQGNGVSGIIGVFSSDVTLSSSLSPPTSGQMDVAYNYDTNVFILQIKQIEGAVNSGGTYGRITSPSTQDALAVIYNDSSDQAHTIQLDWTQNSDFPNGAYLSGSLSPPPKNPSYIQVAFGTSSSHGSFTPDVVFSQTVGLTSNGQINNAVFDYNDNMWKIAFNVDGGGNLTEVAGSGQISGVTTVLVRYTGGDSNPHYSALTYDGTMHTYISDAVESLPFAEGSPPNIYIAIGNQSFHGTYFSFASYTFVSV